MRPAFAMRTEISFDRIIALGVPIAWPEAVAATLHVARAVAQDGVAGLDNCLLSAAGSIRVAGRSRAPFAGNAGAAIFDALLARSHAPRELVALADRRLTDPVVSAADLAHELEFFARPDGGAALRALAARALAADAEARQHAELERLRGVAAAVVAVPHPKTAPARGRRTRWVVLAAAAAVTGLLTFALSTRLTLSVMSSTASDPSASGQRGISQVARVKGQLEALVDKGLATFGFNPGAGVSSSGVATPGPPAPSPSKPTKGRALAVSPRPSLALLHAAPIEPATPAEHRASIATDLALSTDGAAEVTSDLEPPVLRWPQLPNELTTEIVDTSEPYLELQINEGGTVDKVHLHSEQNAFHERMLVSAAKAWVFQPARRNGRPVKYVLRVPLVGR